MAYFHTNLLSAFGETVCFSPKAVGTNDAATIILSTIIDNDKLEKNISPKKFVILATLII